MIKHQTEFLSEKARKAVKLAQAVYDSTPAGMLELQRRLNNDPPPTYRAQYEARLRLGQETRAAQLEALKQKDQGDVGEHASSSLRMTRSVSRTLIRDSEQQRPVFERLSEQHTIVANALINASASWMHRLSPEEIEALSWRTSNGHAVMRSYTNGEEHDIWGYDVYSQSFLEEQQALIDSAMSKAPRLKRAPVVMYRGLGEDHWKGKSPTLDEVREKFPIGSTYTPDMPESASLSPQTAEGFSDGVVLEVEGRTIASPVNFSSYGTGELETLLSIKARYEVVGVLDGANYGEFSVGDKVIKRSTIVVQLREVE